MATALLDYSKERQFRKLSEKSSESVSCVLRGGEQVDIDTKELVVGDDSTQAWAQLQSWFGIMQLGGGLVSGVLSDRFGSKNLLLLSFASSALCYLLQAKATDMSMLYISQVPTLFQ